MEFVKKCSSPTTECWKPETCCPPCPSLTLLGHANFKALLQAAVLTPVPRHFVDDAVLVAVTGIHHVFLDAAAEETLKCGGKEKKVV